MFLLFTIRIWYIINNETMAWSTRYMIINKKCQSLVPPNPMPRLHHIVLIKYTPPHTNSFINLKNENVLFIDWPLGNQCRISFLFFFICLFSQFSDSLFFNPTTPSGQNFTWLITWEVTWEVTCRTLGSAIISTSLSQTKFGRLSKHYWLKDMSHI